MKRHYYISDDLDDLEQVEHDLEDKGFGLPQLHVLSEDDAGVHQHNLHEVEAVLKKDVVHGTEVGAVIGMIAAALVLALAYFTGLTQTTAGWVPFIFLAIVVLGFCTWEGGLFGIQEPNSEFKRFEEDLHHGRHIFFVDAEDTQEPMLKEVERAHPKLQPAGIGDSAPSWFVNGHKRFNSFVEAMP